MIIACPHCSTRFDVNAAALPPAGRKVKCARCGHVWVQRPAQPAAADDEPMPAEAAAIVAPEPAKAPREPRPEATPEMIWAGTDIPPRRPSYGAYWAVGVASIVVLFAASFAYRTEIAAAVPMMGKVYAMIGFPVDTTGLELTIEAKAMNESSQGGASTLLVTGVIANVTSEERPVPQISATLYAEDKRELHSWTFDPGVTSLKPGETHAFKQELAQPPPDTYQVYAHFADTDG